MNQKATTGFQYLVEHLNAAGKVLSAEVLHNLMPYEGLNHAINVILRAGAQAPSWFTGIYETPYTPVAEDIAATFKDVAGECSAYTPATRPLLVLSAPVMGSADNLASRAEFTMTANKTIYGAFVISNNTKGGGAGILLSAARFASPKALNTTDVLRLTAGFNFISL
jgi:hypothetical protein